MYGSVKANTVSSPSGKGMSKGKTIIISLVAISLVVFAAFYNTKPNTATSNLSSDSLNVAFGNKYTLRGDSAVTGYPWTIVEPYFTTFLSVTDADDTLTYKWTLFQERNYRTPAAQISVFYGSSVDFVFTTPGYYSVRVEELDGEVTVRSYEERVMAKYVRREIRNLLDEDREAYFNAFDIIGTYSDNQGQEMYGPLYHSKRYFINEHMIGGGARDCDHWHSGSGFMTIHIGMTLQFEISLQSVDPTISSHYFDFTIDNAELGYSWRDSEVFADDFFGISNPDGGILATGRWAYTPVMQGASSFTTAHNSWDIMKSPWNNDPTPFLTRHDTLYNFEDYDEPKGCEEYYGCLQKTSWTDLASCFNGDAHGRLHQLMGGSTGTAYDELLNSDLLADTPWGGDAQTKTQSFLIETEAFLKELWRGYYADCPDSCDASVAEEDCQCSCTASALEGMTSYEILDDATILRKLHVLDTAGFVVQEKVQGVGVVYSLNGKTDEEQDEIFDGLLTAACTAGYIGTMYEGESPNDITFWTLHPNIDRLWHYMRMSPSYYGFDDTWEDGVYGSCSGHLSEDIPASYTNLFDNNDTPYTNSELYTSLHPFNENLQYVYDNFEYTHCTNMGYDFSNEISAWKETGLTTGGYPYDYEWISK